jgi:uncharacterized protein
MNIIDTHVHLGDIYGKDLKTDKTPYPFKPNTYEQLGYRNIYLGKLNYLFKPLIVSSAKAMTQYANASNLIDSMEESNVTQSIILAVEPNVSTDSVLNICQKNPALIPFGSVHPYDQKKREKLKSYIQAGIKGLKIHPVIQKVSPTDPAMLELLEEASQYDIPVLFHTGWGSIGRGNYGFMYHFKVVLDNFPKTKFIFAHMGFYEPGPFIELIAKHDNVFCDTSWQPEGIIKKAIDKLGGERILYGSDWPYNLQSSSLNIINKITKTNTDLREKILYKNVAELIKL